MEEMFSIQNMFDFYIETNYKDKILPENQYHQLKLCYFGACGHLLVLIRDKISNLEEDEGVKLLNSMLNEFINLYKTESIAKN